MRMLQSSKYNLPFTKQLQSQRFFFAAILAVVSAIEFLPGFKLQLNWWWLTWELLPQFPCFQFWSSPCLSWGSRQLRNRTQIVLFVNLDCIWFLSQDKHKTEGRLKQQRAALDQKLHHFSVGVSKKINLYTASLALVRRTAEEFHPVSVPCDWTQQETHL